MIERVEGKALQKQQEKRNPIVYDTTTFDDVPDLE